MLDTSPSSVGVNQFCKVAKSLVDKDINRFLVNSIELLAFLTLILIGDTLEADSGAPNKIKWLTGQKARR
jgi:hypothetical protein